MLSSTYSSAVAKQFPMLSQQPAVHYSTWIDYSVRNFQSLLILYNDSFSGPWNSTIIDLELAVSWFRVFFGNLLTLSFRKTARQSPIAISKCIKQKQFAIGRQNPRNRCHQPIRAKAKDEPPEWNGSPTRWATV
jgi:hypothetical protein